MDDPLTENFKKARKLYRELVTRYNGEAELAGHLLYCLCKFSADNGISREESVIWMAQYGLTFPNNDTIPENEENEKEAKDGGSI